MKSAVIPSDVRERSRSARERSRNLRVTSQHLRESLENLRAYAAEVNGSISESRKFSIRGGNGEAALPMVRTPMEFTSLARQRVQKARAEAQELRRRAAGLRHQAAEFRAHSEGLLSRPAIIKAIPFACSRLLPAGGRP